MLVQYLQAEHLENFVFLQEKLKMKTSKTVTWQKTDLSCGSSRASVSPLVSFPEEGSPLVALAAPPPVLLRCILFRFPLTVWFTPVLF